MKPAELGEAEMILSLCEAFHVLPSAVLAEDAGLLRLLAIRSVGVPADG